MIKIWITYFYQVRNLPNNIIPFSTAMYDPKWFHKFEDQSKVFVDDNGVINGLRLKQLVFPKDSYNENEPCSRDCSLKPKVEFTLKNFDGNNFGCRFMNTYFKYLLNNIDYDKLINYLEKVAYKFAELNDIDQDEVEIALLVHESPSCPCAERPVLIKWFAEFGYNLEEWQPYEE